ncbi:MAG TPA: ABC transporter permease [Acidimicrobiales bacterium]|jgi:ABC-type transport system involved in multi-copper enzyme maturation permease subunit|nr:ABC transporter permease [Acidimicrobiales bacterium]
MTDIAVPAGLPTATADDDAALVLPNLLRSEWAKLRTVRSTYWSVLVAVAGMIVIGLSSAIGAARSSTHPVTFDPISATIGGFVLAQIALGTLGVLAVTSEYSTGMIRTTFTAAPQRGTVIAAKAVVFGAASFAIGAVVSLFTFLVGQAILGHHGVSLGSPGALRAVIGVGLYLGLLGVIAVGLGTIIRRSAGAIAVLVGLLFVLPALAPLLPVSIRDTVAQLLPYNAGQAIFKTAKSASLLSPPLGMVVFAVYAAAFLAIGVILVRRRDA